MPITVAGTQITFNDSTTQTTASVPTAEAKAWVNINVTSIAASYNVSSITRNAAGDYTINFTNAFSDANYIMVAAGAMPSTSTPFGQPRISTPGTGDPPTLKTTTQCRVGYNGVDIYSAGMAFFR